jgi:CO/xanthine dehydrogenase FAD-binding subunit
MYADYDLAMPDTLSEALGALSDAGASTKILALAGGTNLLVDIRSRHAVPDRVVALGNVKELLGIKCNGEQITIGARTTMSNLLASSEMSRAAPSLIQSAMVFAGQMVRNTATVAGNIACGSPAADIVPPLLSLDAELTLTSKSGLRKVALSDYYLGYKKDVRRLDELITSISWRRPPGNSVNLFYKLARRRGDAITITSVAVMLAAKEGRCSMARIGLGAVSPSPMRAKKAEAYLENRELTPALIETAASQAADECSPIDDIRASASYRGQMVGVLTRRLLSQAWQSLS